MVSVADPWLVACEFSQSVTGAFRAAGIEAFSCDILPTEGNPEWHIQGDAREVVTRRQWGGLIAHIPCTFFTLAGARWFGDPRYPNREIDREEMYAFWDYMWRQPIKKKAFENPQPMQWLMDRAGRYNQKLQPWQFGDAETKGICLWLDNLPPLIPTHSKKPAVINARVWRMPPGPDRQKERSRFFPGVSAAMVEQWGKLS